MTFTSLALLSLLHAAPVGQPSVYALEPEPFTAAAREDLQTLRQFVTGMQGVLARVADHRALFSARRDQVYSPDEKALLLSTWGSLFSYFSATESLREKYWDFVKLKPSDPRHAWGFVLTHTALTALLAYGLAFSELALNNRQLETLFDEQNDEYGVPAHAFAAFKARAIHLKTSTQLVTGEAWAATAIPFLRQLDVLGQPDVTWAWTEMQKDAKAAQASLIRSGAKLFLGNAKDIVKDSSAEAIFPAQKTFAEWAGDTRVHRLGTALISRELVERVALPRLQPGDIVVSRQNWFLSNIGLPGFWPHAQLFVGTAAELAKTFDLEPAVSAWVSHQSEGAHTFSELLQRRYPDKWRTYAHGKDFQGHAPIRVIESISEGVSFTAIEHAYGVDYLAAMRPRLSALDKARAIERAFHYQGRPYDFDFDFFSDATLVCTELVYKAYQPSSDEQGVSLSLVDVAGRRTLPANEIVKKFDAEFEAPAQQLDFVFFIDGHEKERSASESTLAAFRASWKRVKWDLSQK